MRDAYSNLKIFDMLWRVRKISNSVYDSETRRKKQVPITDPFPLVYLTHYEENAAFEKRKATGQRWAGGETNCAEETFKNEWIEGFKVTRHAVRWVTSNVVWRIEDPRGFQLEIYSGNMAAIIQSCVIEKGIIKTPCIWGREGGKNVLIPQDTDDHKKASTNETRNLKRISPREVKPGQIVKTIKGNITVVYLGKYFIHQFSHWNGARLTWNKSRYCFAAVNENNEINWDDILIASKMNVYDKVGIIEVDGPLVIAKTVSLKILENPRTSINGWWAYNLLSVEDLPEDEMFSQYGYIPIDNGLNSSVGRGRGSHLRYSLEKIK